MNKNFALIGAAGYVAPRHMKAIRETSNKLVAALDPNDSVGIIDSYFPQADFFTEFERFDRHVDKLRRKKDGINYLSVCSPNYLHDAHIRFGLRQSADVICEKPIVMNPWNVEALEEMEKETGQSIYNILQLRLHPRVIDLKQRIKNQLKDKKTDIDLTYITSRGNWYYSSWKGQDVKSGGIATNIGVHFYDMLQWIFGDVQESKVHVHTHDRAAGFLELENARVRWFLSINADTLPQDIKDQGQRTFRALTIGEEAFEFSGGFTDLHTRSYEEILDGNGFRISAAKPAIQIVHDIRNQTPIGLKGEYHPFAALPLQAHPFE